jgi:hypothetical protein
MNLTTALVLTTNSNFKMAALMMPLLHRKEKVYRATVCHLTNLTDDELRARYRFGQDSINFLILRMVVCGPLNELVFPGNKCIRHIIHNP